MMPQLSNCSVTLFGKNLETSYFHLDNLSTVAKNELSNIFKTTIPTQLEYLDLKTNDLYQQDFTEIKSSFDFIPDSVRGLGLSYNCLGDKSTEDNLPVLMRAIPQNITHVDLSGNYLSAKSGQQLKNAIDGLHQKIESLDLSANDLSELPVLDFQWLMASVSRFKKINLSRNNLYQKTSDELYEIFSKLNCDLNTTELDLTDNYFDIEQIISIQKALSPFENIIFYDDGQVHTLSSIIGPSAPELAP